MFALPLTFTNEQNPAGIPGCVRVVPRLMDAHTATAICEWSAALGSQRVGVMLDGGNYAAPASNVQLVVAAATKGAGVTGSGQLATSAAAGQFAGATMQVNADASFSKGSANELRGDVRIVVTRGSTMYGIDASLSALSVVLAEGGMTGVASVSTWDAGNPAVVTPLGDDYRMQLRVVDAGEPGAGRDTIALTVWDPSGLLVLSTRFSGLHTDPEAIAAGNLQVH